MVTSSPLTNQVAPNIAETVNESTLQDFVTLTKPGVILLVIFTAIIGLLLPTHAYIHPLIGFTVILSIALGAGGAAAFNMWYDRDIDAIMTRTRKRPLPQGKIQPSDALTFSMFLCGFSLLLMWLSAPQGVPYLLLSILFYTVIYTMILKRLTDQNIVIGGAAGAFPPLIAWVTVTHHVTIEPLILFWIIFIWTPSHFWALAIFRSQDYQDAHIPMLPLTKGIPSTTRAILVYSVLLIISSYLPIMYDFGHNMYMVAITIINIPYLYYAMKLNQSPVPHLAMRLFSYSIFYLFALYLLLLVDKFVI